MPIGYKIIQTGTGATAPWNPDVYRGAPFNIGVGVVVNSTGVTYNVEHTFDAVFGGLFGSSISLVASSAATWFQNSGISAKSTNQDGNYAFPVVGIRLNVTAGSSTGTTTMTLLQAGA